jgi:hypothetical protein
MAAGAANSSAKWIAALQAIPYRMAASARGRIAA